jgi:hypothetical protein
LIVLRQIFLGRLGVDDRAGAIAAAIKRGFIHPE